MYQSGREPQETSQAPRRSPQEEQEYVRLRQEKFAIMLMEYQEMIRNKPYPENQITQEDREDYWEGAGVVAETQLGMTKAMTNCWQLLHLHYGGSLARAIKAAFNMKDFVYDDFIELEQKIKRLIEGNGIANKPSAEVVKAQILQWFADVHETSELRKELNQLRAERIEAEETAKEAEAILKSEKEQTLRLKAELAAFRAQHPQPASPTRSARASDKVSPPLKRKADLEGQPSAKHNKTT